jgi:hypothetical protein
VHADNSNHQ